MSSSPRTATKTSNRRLVLDALAQGPGTYPELSERTGLPPKAVTNSLMRLTALDIVTAIGDYKKDNVVWELWSDVIERLRRGERRLRVVPKPDVVRAPPPIPAYSKPAVYNQVGQIPQRGGPRIPCEPFATWLDGQLRLLAADFDDPHAQLSSSLGIVDRTLWRFMHHRDSNGHPSKVFGRYAVEDILTRAGVSFYDLYPEYEHERDIVLEPDSWCSSCATTTTPIDGVCPWCETVTVAPLALAA